MRYAINKLNENVARLSFDVAIIGSGIAGLYTALNIGENRSCCVLTKEGSQESSSWLAQGGIAAAIALDDKPKYHFDDTIIAGAGLCDEGAVRVLVSEGPREIRTLIDLKVPFDLDADGELDTTREGGHRHNRIVHAGGDATGRETVKVLAQLVSRLPNVSFLANYFLVDILTDESGAVSGLVALDGNNAPIIIDCPNVVIATGGIGQVYKTSTNPAVATGDGLSAAMRAGAGLRDMEFIQFHPTGLWTGENEERSFLISEAVRGEGGLLKNAKGVRFMVGAHELAELAPRDIVARGIFREMAKTGADHVFVDITDKSEDYLARRFPTIFQECRARGIDIAKEPIPVCPVQHYLIGGIKTDLNARTSIPGLYACGEAAGAGVHGGNRLASNSMLECLVFGRRAAEDIERRLAASGERAESALPAQEARPEKALDFGAIRGEIQELMSEHCGVLRSGAGMKFAQARVGELLSELESTYAESRAYFEALSLATVALAILTAAIAREDSVGAHFREDMENDECT